MKSIRVFWALGLLFGLNSCGITLPATMPVPEIPAAEIKADLRPLHNVVLSVEEVKDSRSSSVLASQGIEKSEPTSDISLRVKEAIKQTLRARGYAIDDSAPIVINCKVKRWIATVSSGLVKAEAEFSVELSDPTGRRIYTGTYQGYSTLESSALRSHDVSKALGSAFANALSQMATDKRLADLAASF